MKLKRFLEIINEYKDRIKDFDIVFEDISTKDIYFTMEEESRDNISIDSENKRIVIGIDILDVGGKK